MQGTDWSVSSREAFALPFSCPPRHPFSPQVGMFTEVRQLSASVTQQQLEAAVGALCADPRIDGVLVQLPLPPHINEEAVIDSFDPQKDVDGFHPLNMGAKCGVVVVCCSDKVEVAGDRRLMHTGSMWCCGRGLAYHCGAACAPPAAAWLLTQPLPPVRASPQSASSCMAAAYIHLQPHPYPPPYTTCHPLRPNPDAGT